MAKVQLLQGTAHRVLLIKDLLSNRSHFVNVNGTASDSASVISGIPQGSVIGHLLFEL